MQQGIERGSRDRGKTGETWRLEEPERSHNGSGDDKRQSELHPPSDGRSRATLQTQLRKLHALGWMDERKCQGAAGICDEKQDRYLQWWGARWAPKPRPGSRSRKWRSLTSSLQVLRCK